MNHLTKIGFGGGCHWCTEAVFQNLIGVKKVEQGWIASNNENESFSEAVIVHYNPERIPLSILISVHLRTHQSTSNHSFRKKYRSAIYYFNETDKNLAQTILQEEQKEFDLELITKILPFSSFKASREEIQNYYKRNPQKPFCQRYINPKLEKISQQFSAYIN